MKCDCIEKVKQAALDTADANKGVWPAIDITFRQFAARLTPPAEAARGEEWWEKCEVETTDNGFYVKCRTPRYIFWLVNSEWRRVGEAHRPTYFSTESAARAALAAASPPGQPAGWTCLCGHFHNLLVCPRCGTGMGTGQPAAQSATAEFDAEKWAERVRYHIDNSPSVNRVEIIASEGGLLWLSAYAAGLAAQQPKTFAGEKVEGVTVLKWSDAHGGEWQQWPTRWLERGMVYQPMPPSPKEVR